MEYTNKEVLADGLSAQKATTSLMNMVANECVHDNVRNSVLRVLDEEHKIQVEVFNMMHKRGLYETPVADEGKIEKTKQKFSNCY